MQPVMQWITRSSGRTLVRSAQVEEGMRKREERRVLGGGEGRGFRFQLKGDKGGGADFEAFVHFLVFGSRGRPISLPRSFSPIALSSLPMTWLLGIALPHS